MSIRAMVHVWEHSRQKGNALLLLLAIADAANDDDWSCYPGLQRLAKKARVGKRGVQKLLKQLEESGELQVQRNEGVKTSHGRTNLYRVLPAQGVYSGSPQGVYSGSPQGVYSGSPKSSVEPKEEPISAPGGADLFVAPVEEPSKPPRAANQLYDVVKEVWGYTSARNGKYQKFLTGQPKHIWSEYNIAPGMTPDEIREWAKWYRKVELHDDPKMNMVESAAKIQSSVAKWREQRIAGALTPERQATMSRMKAMPVFFLTPPRSELVEEAL